MDRFMGMMPYNEVEIDKRYRYGNGSKVRLQAGPHGWTIIFDDMSSECYDVDATTDNNLMNAYELARVLLKVNDLVEVPSRSEKGGVSRD